MKPEHLELMVFQDSIGKALNKIPYIKQSSVKIGDYKLIFNIVINESMYVAYRLINPLSIEEIIEQWINRPYLPTEINVQYE